MIEQTSAVMTSTNLQQIAVEMAKSIYGGVTQYAPILAEEVVARGLMTTYLGSWLGVGLFVLGVALFVFYFVAKAKQWLEGEEVAPAVIGLFLIVVGIIVGCINTYEHYRIKTAPTIYVIEQIRQATR